MNKISGIYRIKNIANNHCYIGQSVNICKRRRTHFEYLQKNKHHSPYLQRAYNKYGKENFEFDILLYCESFELTRYEQFFVNMMKPEYNMYKECVNSPRGVTVTEETRSKMSAALINRQKNGVSEETRHKRSLALSGSNNPMFGKHLSDETKKKISESLKGRILSAVSDETKKKMSESAKGKHKGNFSEEHKIKIGIANRGKIVSDETKKKMSAAAKRRTTYPMRGKHHSDESKQKISDATKGKGHKHTEEAKQKMSESMKKSWQRRRQLCT
jgi:group I intron endonuclease